MWLKKLIILCRGHLSLVILTIVGTFYESELQKTNQREFRIKKVIKWNVYKLYVKWKDYDSSVNSWIDKKDIV